MILYRISRVVVEGMLRGKCIPADIRVNESVPEYIVRAFNAGADAQRELAKLRKEFVTLSNNYAQLHEQYDLEVNPERK